MAKLARLKIGGIRSFGTKDEDIQSIQFSSPVTLILGENGCGKTTIIEALRYGCTGEVPDGTDKGARFIQEPRLAGLPSAITKGFVKLELIDAKEKPIVINRGAKVEAQSNGKLKYSKLDCSVNTKRPDGTEVALSGRCADIGEQVCLIMGVQKSIINNVLFCHQENSLWPLAEDSKLMNKFDEIFDATKYNKCITEFRKYVNAEKKDLLKSTVSEKEERKNLVERRRAALQNDEDNLNEIIENINRKEDEVKPITDEIEKICELEIDIGSLRAELVSKETQKSSLENNKKLILSKIKEEYPGSDYDLEEAINRFEEKKSNNFKEMKVMETKITKLEEQFGKIDADIQKAQVRIGQLEAGKRQQQEKLKERNKEITTVAKQLKLNAKIQTEDEVKETITTIHNALKEFQGNINEEREINQHEEKIQQQGIDTYRENIAKLEQEKNSNVTQRNEIQNQQRDINSQLKQLDVSDELLRTMNNKIDQLNRQIKFLLESYDPNELEKKIKHTGEEIESLEKKLESLEEEYLILQKNYVTEENITTRTRDMVEKESKLFEIKNAQHKNFKLLFENPPDTDFQNAVERRMREINGELDDLKQRSDIEKQKIFSNQASIRTDEQKLKSYEKKVYEYNRKVNEMIKNDSFEQICVDLEKDIENLQKDRGQFRSAKIIYEKFVKDFQSPKPCCPVCNTNFDNQKSIASQIVVKLKSQIDGIPQALELIEIELKEKQDIYTKTQQLKPLYEETKELENSTIPDLKREISKSKELLHSAEENLKQLNDKIKNPKQLLDIAGKVISDATLFDKYNSEVGLYKKEINDLRIKLLPTNSDRSREEVDRTIRVCKRDILEKRKSCDCDTKKLSANRKEYHELKEQKSEVEKEKFNLEKSMHSKPQLVDQLLGLEEKERHLNSETKRIDHKLLPLSEELKDALKKLHSLKNENELKYKNNVQDYNQVKAGLDSITKIQAAIEDIAHKNIDDQIKTVLRNYQSHKTEEEILNNEKKELSENILRIKAEETKAEINKRNLEDNVEMRKKGKEIELLDQSITQLRIKIGTYNYTTLARKKVELEQQNMTLIKEISNIKGQKDILEKNIANHKKELNLPENKNAYNIYKRALFELETKKHAIHDANIYITGLEEAIVQFHKEKMNKINEAIRELWRSVYKGNDIDYIQIKTEPPQSKESSTKRNYNYRVILIKNGVEVDMRGRCSAGQKVLACLLIRMALAMTFSHNCGILALDEPTTNLDKENVDSLCETLGCMIQNRRIEKNFQLLIITHDEDFIKTLSQMENIDHCLRVTRNKDGNSVVKTEYFT